MSCASVRECMQEHLEGTRHPLELAGRLPDWAQRHLEGCGPCRRVKDTLKELSLDIEWRDIHRSESALSELVTIGKLQQVPCLFVDGKPMYESAATVNICRRWLQPMLLPD